MRLIKYVYLFYIEVIGLFVNNNKIVSMYEDYLEKYPYDKKTTFILANIYFNNKDYINSEYIYTKYLELNTNKNKRYYIVLNNLACCYYYQNKYLLALDVYSKIIHDNKETYVMLANMANCYYLLGDLKKAENYYNLSIEINPFNNKARSLLSNLYTDMKITDLK